MEYYSAMKRNRFESLLKRWTNLEPLMQSEVRKRNINILYWCIYMESKKIVLITLFSGQQWRNRQRADLWTRGEGRRER